MRAWVFVLFLLGLTAVARANDPVVLVIHGGIGDSHAEVSPALEKQLKEKMEQSLLMGYALLKKNGSSLDAVVAAIKVMEDSPLFNAGKGAVFTREGKNELDAAIMEGKTKKAGAVAGVTTVKNPILAARAVMEKTKHVFLVGPGADAFAKEAGLEIVPNSYFKTDKAWQEYQDFLASEKKSRSAADSKKVHYGTVGAVALDTAGNLVAGTSTGGLTGKMPGRVGDSPVIGAGTYADNDGCGVSATGQGEFFIRVGVGHEINARVKLGKMGLQQAADSVVMKTLKEMGGEGGVISLNKKGEVGISFNTSQMYHGFITKSGKTTVVLFK